MQIDMSLQYDIEQFYFREARTLDERRYRDWLDFFADDVHYWMPIRRTTWKGRRCWSICTRRWVSWEKGAGT